MSSALTAKTVSFMAAPADVKYDITKTMHTVRRKMSLFTEKKRDMPRASNTSTHSGRGKPLAYLMRHNATHMARPVYCAVTIPSATPLMPNPRTYTKNRLAAMFTRFCVIATTMG